MKQILITIDLAMFYIIILLPLLGQPELMYIHPKILILIFSQDWYLDNSTNIYNKRNQRKTVLLINFQSF